MTECNLCSKEFVVSRLLAAIRQTRKYQRVVDAWCDDKTACKNRTGLQVAQAIANLMTPDELNH